MIRTKIDNYFLADVCRSLNTTMTVKQGDAVRLIAEECDNVGMKDPIAFSYMLATCYHESNFLPQKERRARAGSELRRIQDRYWYTGFYGRGYVQLTHKENYQQFSAIMGHDFINNPDKVLIPEYSAFILVYGMTTGAFTQRRLGHFINPYKTDLLGARRVVNGTDQAERIAIHTLKILPCVQKILLG